MKKIKTICIAGRIYCGVWNQTCLFELETSFIPALGEQLKEIDNFLANIANALIVAMKQTTIIWDFNVEIDVNIHANLLLDIPNQVFVDCYVGAGDSRRSHDEQGALFSLIYQRKIKQPTIVVLDRGL